MEDDGTQDRDNDAGNSSDVSHLDGDDDGDDDDDDDDEIDRPLLKRKAKATAKKSGKTQPPKPISSNASKKSSNKSKSSTPNNVKQPKQPKQPKQTKSPVAPGTSKTSNISNISDTDEEIDESDQGLADTPASSYGVSSSRRPSRTLLRAGQELQNSTAGKNGSRSAKRKASTGIARSYAHPWNSEEDLGARPTYTDSDEESVQPASKNPRPRPLADGLLKKAEGSMRCKDGKVRGDS
jgi:hypothetical protein